MQNKNSFDALKVFDFIVYLEAFKKLERFKGQVFWRDFPYPERYESDADHTWRMAMILIVVEKYLSQKIDLERALKMLLVHDIPEMIAGDASPLGSDGTGMDSHAYNSEIKVERHKNEDRAASEVFSKLPGNHGEELHALWHEFEAQESFEAQLVKAIDKFEGKLQSYEYTGAKMFPQQYEFNMTYGVETFAVDPVMQELADILLQKVRDEYVPFEKGAD